MIRLIRTLFAAALIAVTPWVAAETFPWKPIRIVVPYPAGGPTDLLARALAQGISPSLGQPVIIENKPGASTIIGASYVAKSDPDGHTILLCSDGTMSINPLTRANLPYDPQKDFAPLTLATFIPEYLYIIPSVPANTLQEFIALAKASPGKFNYGSYGRGSSAHIEAEAFKVATGTDLVHVPFKGGSEVMTAMLGGQIQVWIGSAVAPLQSVRAGKIKALAGMGHERSSFLPDVPTFTEAGLKGFESDPWFGLFVPAKTPKGTQDRLIAEMTKVMEQPAFRKQFIEDVGLAVAPLGRAGVRGGAEE